MAEGMYHVYVDGPDDTILLAPYVDVRGGYAGGEFFSSQSDPDAPDTGVGSPPWSDRGAVERQP